jgi:hypothetical protein
MSIEEYTAKSEHSFNHYARLKQIERVSCYDLAATGGQRFSLFG